MKKEKHMYLESEEFHKPNFIHVSTRPKFCACLLTRYILELADFHLGSRGYGKVLTVVQCLTKCHLTEKKARNVDYAQEDQFHQQPRAEPLFPDKVCC